MPEATFIEHEPEPIDARGLAADLDAVEVLARAVLEAHRRYDRLETVIASEALRDLVEFCGLADVIEIDMPAHGSDGSDGSDA
jgi:hypothetical protein